MGASEGTVPRCCGTVFHREAYPGATGELGSGPEGAPGHGVPEERQGGGFAREGEAGAAVYKEAEGRQQQGQDMEAQVLGRRRGWAAGSVPRGTRGWPQEASGGGQGRRGHCRKYSLGLPAQEGLAWEGGAAPDNDTELRFPTLQGNPSCPLARWGPSPPFWCLPQEVGPEVAPPASISWGPPLAAQVLFPEAGSSSLPALSQGPASPALGWACGKLWLSGAGPDLACEPQGPCPLAALQAGLQPPTVPWEES